MIKFSFIPEDKMELCEMPPQEEDGKPRWSCVSNFGECTNEHRNETGLEYSTTKEDCEERCLRHLARQHMGSRDYQEDVGTTIKLEVGDKDYRIFVILDGHGGDWVAYYIGKELRSVLLSKLQRKLITNENYETWMKELFLDIDVKVHKKEEELVNNKVQGIEKGQTGSTMSIAIFDEGTKTLFAAQVGDSKMLFFDKSINIVDEVLEDHTPNPQGTGMGKAEYDRVSQHSEFDPNENRIYGINMTRAMGDTEAKQPLEQVDGKWTFVGKRDKLLSEPSVRMIKVGEEGGLLVIASDGLYEKVDEFVLREHMKRGYTHVDDMLQNRMSSVGQRFDVDWDEGDNTTYLIIEFK